MARPDNPEDADIRALLRDIGSRWWIILAVVAASVGVAVANAGGQPKMYAANGVVRVVNPNSTSVLGSSGRPDSAREVSLQVLYARSPQIRAMVESRLGIDLRKRAKVTIAEVSNADAIRIHVESSDPAAAKLVADTYVEVYIEERRKAVSGILANQAQRLNDDADALGVQVAALSSSIDGLTPVPVVDSQGRVLYPPESEGLKSIRSQRDLLATRREEVIKQLEQVKFESSVRQGDVELVTGSQLPTKPFSPKPLRDVVVAGAVGLFLGLVIVLVLARLDDRVRRPGEIDDLVGAPVTAVPLERRGRGKSGPALVVDAGASAGGEAFRNLRAAVMYSGGDGESVAAVVTSPSPGEGKTTVAANLAAVIAMSGRSVLLVDLDLYRPSIHEIFDIPQAPGFTSLVRGEDTFENTTRPVSVGDGCLHVLAAGPAFPNPAELVMSPRSVQWLATMRDAYDVMICDCPPITAVADALSLAPLFSGVVLVARAGSTRARTIRSAVDQLAARETPILAVVLNGVRRGSPYMGTYGTVSAEREPATVIVPIPDLDPDREQPAPVNPRNGSGGTPEPRPARTATTTLTRARWRRAFEDDSAEPTEGRATDDDDDDEDGGGGGAR